MATVTADDLRELLDAPDGTTLVIEEGETRLVPAAEAAEGMPVLARTDLLALLGGEGADGSDETLRLVAQGLGSAVRAQGG
jgi:hypothetical protein